MIQIYLAQYTKWLYDFSDMEIPIEEFGPFLRRTADAEGPAELAKRLGVSRSTLYLMFKGAWPSEEVCRVLGVQFSIPDVKKRGKVKK